MADSVTTLRKQVRALEDEIARLGGVLQRTVTALDAGEPAPLRDLREALTGRFYNRWDHDSMIDAAHRWRDEFGAPPKAAEWNPKSADAKTAHRERFYSGVWPTTRMVTTRFVTWNTFMRACGFVPRTGPDDQAGQRYDPTGWPAWTGWELLPHFRAKAGLTQGALAHAANCSVSLISKTESNGHEQPPNPSIRLLMALAIPLGVKTAALID